MQAIAYVRRSTDRQEESITQQRERLESYAESKGWNLVTTYSDDAISGSNLNRPGLSELLNAVSNRKDIDVVLVWDRNRLARPKDAVDGLMLEKQILNQGKRVIYASTNQEADHSFTSGLLSYIEHHQNGDYLRKLSRDTMRGLVSRAQQGLWPGGPIPFGFDRLILRDDHSPKRIVRNMDDGSQIVIDVESNAVIEEIPKGKRFKKQDHELCSIIPSIDSRVQAIQKLFSDYANGQPIRMIRDRLNESGFRTSRGVRFTPQTIGPMLENPAYIGRLVYNRRTESKWHRHVDGRSVERRDEGVENRPESDWIVKENSWPALVDQSTFEKVQIKRKESKKNHVRGHAIKAHYLLGGRMICGVCGGKLHGVTRTSGKGYKTRYYTCSTHNNGHHDKCPKRYSVPANRVEDYVIDLICTDLQKLQNDDRLHEYVTEEVNRLNGMEAHGERQLQQRLAELDQQIAKLKEHLLNMPPETAKSLGLYDQANDLTEERSEVENQIQALALKSPQMPAVSDIKKRSCDALKEIKAILESASIE